LRFVAAQELADIRSDFQYSLRSIYQALLFTTAPLNFLTLYSGLQERRPIKNPPERESGFAYNLSA